MPRRHVCRPADFPTIPTHPPQAPTTAEPLHLVVDSQNGHRRRLHVRASVFERDAAPCTGCKGSQHRAHLRGCLPRGLRAHAGLAASHAIRALIPLASSPRPQFCLAGISPGSLPAPSFSASLWPTVSGVLAARRPSSSCFLHASPCMQQKLLARRACACFAARRTTRL